jgi:hypothetical protein
MSTHNKHRRTSAIAGHRTCQQAGVPTHMRRHVAWPCCSHIRRPGLRWRQHVAAVQLSLACDTCLACDLQGTQDKTHPTPTCVSALAWSMSVFASAVSPLMAQPMCSSISATFSMLLGSCGCDDVGAAGSHVSIARRGCGLGCCLACAEGNREKTVCTGMQRMWLGAMQRGPAAGAAGCLPAGVT